MSVSPRLAVMVTFDCWPWPALGCYGNDWIDTPGWDALAAEGFAFDRCVATAAPGSPTVARLLVECLKLLGANDVTTALFCEEQAKKLNADGWNHAVTIPGRDDFETPVAQTRFAQTVAAAAEWLTRRDSQQPGLVWIHAAGLIEPCVFPRSALDLYADDFAEDGLDVWSLSPETLASHEVARATALSLLDHWLIPLCDAVRDHRGPKLLSLLAWKGTIWEPAPRRSPLLADADPQQRLAPWIVWSSVMAEWVGAGRSSALVTTTDVFATLTDWFGLSGTLGGVSRSVSPLLTDIGNRGRPFVATGEDSTAIWTSADLTLLASSATDSPAQRFLLPEDMWAVNDVADQSPEIVAERRRSIESSSR